MVVDHIDYPHPSYSLGQLANDVLSILPPFYFAIGVDMQILSCGTVRFPFASIHIHFGPGLPGRAVKPVRDIATCSTDQWQCQWIRNVVLHESRQVVHLAKEDDLNVIGCIVLTHFLHHVVSLLTTNDWQILL